MTAKTYRLTYSIEAGYAVNIKAKSPEAAEAKLKAMLDDIMDTLPDSERVHFAAYV